MKVIKIDLSKNHFRVIQIFAYFPMRIFVCELHAYKWVFLKRYYQFQLDSYWGRGWLKLENSFNQKYWDYKWSEEYLKGFAEDPLIISKYPPKYRHS